MTYCKCNTLQVSISSKATDLCWLGGGGQLPPCPPLPAPMLENMLKTYIQILIPNNGKNILYLFHLSHFFLLFTSSEGFILYFKIHIDYLQNK